MPLGMEVGLGAGDCFRWGPIFFGPSDIVLDGDPAPLSKKGQSPRQFSAHVYGGNGRPSQLLLSSLYFIK